MSARYSFGGDEHLFVEIADEMSLEAFFKGLFMARVVAERKIAGVSEICPSNASLQVKFDPDIIAPEEILNQVRAIESLVEDAEPVLQTRIVEMPVYYQDPWTHETGLRFRERHQDPLASDLEYGARVNGYDTVEAFIAAHAGSPWFVSMVGFVSGLPFMYQMVGRERQIQVPKYLRPRTDTPPLTVGHGGCFAAVYSVRGAGGYQMFGITPMTIYDPTQKTSYLKDFMVFFKPGDIVKFSAVGRSGYDRIREEVAQGRFIPKVRDVSFDLREFNADISSYNRQLEGLLNGH